MTRTGRPRSFDREKIIELYDQGLELQEIADTVGCSIALVGIAVKDAGRSPFLRHYPHRENVDNAAMLQDYQDGMPIGELCEKHNLHYSRVHQLRKEAGIPLRERHGMSGKQNYQYKHGMAKEKRGRNTSIAKQVVAICLGHIVPRRWHIHHMDEDPSNNRPENLAIFHSCSGHACYHQQLLKSQREGLEVDAIQLVLENDGQMLPIPDHPVALPHEIDRLSPRKKKAKPTQNP